MAVFRNVADFHFSYLPRLLTNNRLVLNCNLARASFSKSCNSLNQLGLTIAINTSNTNNLTSSDIKRKSLNSWNTTVFFNNKIFYRQDSFLRISRLFSSLEGNSPSHHHFSQILVSCTSDFNCFNGFSATNNRYAVRNCPNFIQLVSDKNDRLSFFDEILHDFHQFIDLSWRQNGCRLVKDKNVRPTIKCFQNLNPLLSTDRDIFNLSRWINCQAVFLRQFLNFFSGTFQVQHTIFGNFTSKNDIFSDSKCFNKHKVLVHHPDTK